MTDWYEDLKKEENNKAFSLLVHNYFKFAVMRIMQELIEKHDVPPEDIQTLVTAIIARMLNESVYSVGAQIRENYPISAIYSDIQVNNLIDVLTGKRLDPLERPDLKMDKEERLNIFRQFVLEHKNDRLQDGEK